MAPSENRPEIESPQLPENVRTILLQGGAVKLEEIMLELSVDNVDAVKLLVQQAPRGHHVTLVDDLVQFSCPRFQCQVCFGTFKDENAREWLQCTQCFRQTCVECNENIGMVGGQKGTCPSCNGTLFLMPLTCSGCMMSILNIEKIVSWTTDQCPNCSSRVTNSQGDFPSISPLIRQAWRTATPSRSSLPRNPEGQQQTRRRRRTSARSTTTRNTRRSSRTRGRTTTRSDTESNLVTVTVLTRYQDDQQMAREIVFKTLSNMIFQFNPQEHIQQWNFRIRELIPCCLIRHDAFAEEYRAGQLVYKVNARNAFAVRYLVGKRPPLPERDVARLASFKNPLFKEMTISRALGILPPEEGRFSRRDLKRYVQEFHQARVGHYTKLFKPRQSDIIIHDHQIVYLIKWEFYFQLKSGKNYFTSFLEAPHGIKIITSSWNGLNAHCNACSLLVQGVYPCTKCNQATCASCTISDTFMGKHKTFCSRTCHDEFKREYDAAGLLKKARMIL